jgi:hypothetical protein
MTIGALPPMSKLDVHSNLSYEWTSTNTLFYSMFPESRRWSTARRKKARRTLYLRLCALEREGAIEGHRISHPHVEWRKI